MPGTHLVDFSKMFDVALFRRNYLRSALGALDLDAMRFNDLRHTFASLILTDGFPSYEVLRWLGHAILATTDSIDAHLCLSEYASHVDRFEAFMAETS